MREVSKDKVTSESGASTQASSISKILERLLPRHNVYHRTGDGNNGVTADKNAPKRAAAQQEIEAYAKSEVIKELEALTEEAEFAQHMMDDGFDHEAVRTTHIEDRISGLKGKK